MAYDKPTGLETDDSLEQELMARHAEINSEKDLMTQRGTPIPALFNQFYKFIQNPSTVSVETYKRMVDTDDTVGAGVDFLVTCLVARIGGYNHPNEEIRKFVNDALDKVEGGWKDAIKEMLSASWTGFMVLEKVWANADMGFILSKLVPLPPGTILFETDRTGALTPDGILQYQRNYNPGMAGLFGGGVGNFGFEGGAPDQWAKYGDYPYPLRVSNAFNYLSIRIPTEKCVHYAFNAQGKFGNPYGRSLLRRAYKFYVLKDAFLKMMAVALNRKGTPLTIVFADPNSTMRENLQGNTSKQAAQTRRTRADLAVAEAFKNVDNESVIILPGRKDEIYSVQELAQASNVTDFIAAIELCNKSILRALLIPSLIFTNGDGTGSFALGQEHAKTFDKILDGWLEGAQNVLLQQVIRELIAYNFPESMWKKDGLGSFSKRELTQDEREKQAEMFDKAVNTGYVSSADLNDFNHMREAMGFEPREATYGVSGIDFADDPMGASGTTDVVASGADTTTVVADPASTTDVVGGSGAAPVTSVDSADHEDTAFNGAQVTSMIDVVAKVAAKEIPRESGVAILQIAFQLPPEQAEAVMGEVGRGFFAEPPAPKAPFGGVPGKEGKEDEKGHNQGPVKKTEA